jgi:aromatic-L-amino-acid decarboxylase
VPAAGLADFIACMTNRYVGVTAAAPALARIEATAIEWLATLVGLPPGAGGILTSGGSLSNLAGIVAARSARLPRGRFPARDPLLLARDARLGRQVGAPGRFLVAEPARRARRRPACAWCPRSSSAWWSPTAPAASRRSWWWPTPAPPTPVPSIPSPRWPTSRGATDLWLHGDAAYGGFFRLVSESLVPGLELCDSLTLDPHKGLFLPYGTGCLLVRDPEALRRAHASDAHYLQDVAAAHGEINFTDLSPELSRDFRGLRLWLPFQLHGVACLSRPARGEAGAGPDGPTSGCARRPSSSSSTSRNSR